MARELNVHKNDTVVVISGNYRGKRGKVLKVFPETRGVIVEGVNIIKKATRPSQKNPQGGIVQKEAKINASNVKVICPKCNQPTRIGHKYIKDVNTNKRRPMRVCKKCNEMF